MPDKEFQAAVDYAELQGYKVETAGAGFYLTWVLTDRDRALLALLRKDLTNHRAIRFPIPDRIATREG